MKKTAFLLMIIATLSKLLGFVREIVLTYTYGATAISDAYLISQTIPLTIFALISAGIATSYVPLYSQISKEHNLLVANKFTSNLTNLLLILASITVIVVLLFTEPIVRMFALGFDAETLTMAADFTRIGVFSILIIAIMDVFCSYLRQHDNYLIAAMTGFPMNIIIIIALFLSTKTNIYVLIVGGVLAAISQFLLLMPSIKKTGYKHRFVINFKDKYIKKMVWMAIPVILGRSVQQINNLVDKTLASRVAVGGISALSYANKLDGFIQGLFVTSIVTVLYPTIAKMVANKDMKGLKRSINEAIATINLLVVPATVGAMLYSREVVVLLFGRGAFTATAIEMTSSALFYYSIGMVAIGLREVLSRAFYSFQDTKTPMVNATIGVVINIVLNIILSRYLGIGGLALATSAASIITAFLMFVTLRRKIGGFGLKEIIRSFIKIGIASLVMGGCSFASFLFLKTKLAENVALIAAVIIGITLYGIIIYFMKIPEVDSTLQAVKKKLGLKIKSK